MCRATDAAEERCSAAEQLRQACEGKAAPDPFRLRDVFQPVPLDQGWAELMGKLRAAGGSQ